MQNKDIKKIEIIFNFLALLGICFLLLITFVFQFFMHELPCPLCLLQRLGFSFIGLGFLANLRFGLRPSHYAIILFGAFFTCITALRQISLHIIPGTGSYGSAIFGLHMYTWSFILGGLTLLVVTMMLGIDRQYQPVKTSFIKKGIAALGILFFLIAVGNVFSTFAMCKFSACPDNPETYPILSTLS